MTGALVYGLTKTLGIFFFVLLATWEAKREGLDEGKILLGSFVAVISGYLGGRIWYLAQHWRWFAEGRFGNPLWSWTTGGDVLYGWVFGGSLGVYLAARLQKFSFFRLMDLLLPFAILGQAVGRWGCFASGCCYGTKTNLPWAVKYPFLSFPVHPVQLYEVATDLLIFIFLLAFRAKNKEKVGTTTLAYFLLYPSSRFFLEFFRGDQQHFLFDLSIPQVASLVLIFTAVTVAFLRQQES